MPPLLGAERVPRGTRDRGLTVRTTICNVRMCCLRSPDFWLMQRYVATAITIRVFIRDLHTSLKQNGLLALTVPRQTFYLCH
jgi:hypothetical protein